MELISFILKSKKNTYASGKPPIKLEDGFEEFSYKEEDFEYRDRYHALDPKPFGGEEVVWKNKKAVWIMHYYGFVVDLKIDSDLLYTFLRKAMSNISEDSPFRGPKNLKEGDFEYKNDFKGNITKFRGTEKIYFKGNEVYCLDYHGGEL